jgi:hypothetical protein
MEYKIIISLIVSLALFTASIITTTNIYAQSTNKINQTKAGADATAMNKTSQTSSNNGTQGAGAALQNQTSKGLSNAVGSVMQGIKGLFGGNGQKQ